MKTNGLELVLHRNTFYKDSYKRALSILLCLVGLNSLLGGMIFYTWMNPPPPQYFATTADGRIIVTHPLNDPVVTDDFVLQWSTDAVRNAFSLDYIHWRDQLQLASTNFTPDGWRWFTNSLKKSNNLNSIIDLKMVTNAEITGTPIILEKAIINGHYAWKIQMPVLISYVQPAGKSFNMPMKVTLIVLRMPVETNPQRIAINNFIAETVNPGAFNNQSLTAAMSQ